MIFYLTYNDLPSGIFSSQVIDVVKFLNDEIKSNVKLVSFISSRNFFNNRSKIKTEYPQAIVLPMFPGVHRWKYNTFLLGLLVFFKRPHTVIGRSVLATQLALKLKKKGKVRSVIYDGRGAIMAEWKEYGVITNTSMLNDIFELEKEVVTQSDYRIAVSNQLINYWQETFHYVSDKHVVIPCTLNKIFEEINILDSSSIELRKQLGLSNTDTVFIYSGSVAGWQSFGLLYDFIVPVLRLNATHRIIFLSDQDENIQRLKEEFNSQVFCEKVMQHEVSKYLLASNYALLIREESITNKVASPVKFAEYITCGLPVIISKKLGDYSDFVIQNKCGYLTDGFHIEAIDKKYLNKIGIDNFAKKQFLQSYSKLLNLNE